MRDLYLLLGLCLTVHREHLRAIHNLWQGHSLATPNFYWQHLIFGAFSANWTLSRRESFFSFSRVIFVRPCPVQERASCLTTNRESRCANSWEPCWLGAGIEAKLLGCLSSISLPPSQPASAAWSRAKGKLQTQGQAEMIWWGSLLGSCPSSALPPAWGAANPESTAPGGFFDPPQFNPAVAWEKHGKTSSTASCPECSYSSCAALKIHQESTQTVLVQLLSWLRLESPS